MITRLKPYLNKEEVLAIFKHNNKAVPQFEAEFAKTFEAKHAISFAYGRSALWAFFKALGIENSEIIMPAYTCVVVAHAIVLSGNIPRFVDITLYDYNMDLDQVESAINERTRVIIATHLFGYPLNVDRLSEIVRDAEKRYGHKIWVIQDCAHSFGARWKGKLVCNEGDAALFGLNISKMITSVFGGMLTTNNAELNQKMRSWRDAHFHQPGALKSLKRSIYLLATYPAFNESIYGLVHWLQESTPFLNRLTKAYHLDGKIHFPPDYLDQMLPVEARVGLEQLKKYPEILLNRQETVHLYDSQLRKYVCWTLPPIVEGSTYSHYAVLVSERENVLKAFLNHGVQLGQLIDYSIPHMREYGEYMNKQDYPNSKQCSMQIINLPIHSSLHSQNKDFILSCAKSI